MKKLFSLFIIGFLILNLRGQIFAQEQPPQESPQEVQEPALQSEAATNPQAQIQQQGKEERLKALRQKWQNLSPEQKSRLKAKFKTFKKMSPQEREKVLNNLKRYKNLSPEKRELLVKKFKKWQSFSPGKKKAFKQRFLESKKPARKLLEQKPKIFQEKNKIKGQLPKERLLNKRSSSLPNKGKERTLRRPSRGRRGLYK